MGDGVRRGSGFQLRGPPTHRYRMIQLDVLVRQFISSVTLEYYADDSARYAIHGASARIGRVVATALELRAHCVVADREHWLLLLSPICGHCLRAWRHHAPEGGKCLFEASQWSELPIPDLGYLPVRD